ncbi:MAG: hypothetical protein ACOY5Y_20950 [Pseudomonadota bacterium]
MRRFCGLVVIFMIAVGAHASAAAPALSDVPGFALYAVSAEAGVHPLQPNPGDEKVLTNDGHAYWLRREPILRGGIAGANAREDAGMTFVVLQLTRESASIFSNYASNYSGNSVGVVLDGRMIGSEIHIGEGFGAGDTPLRALMLPARNRFDAEILAMQFRRVIERDIPSRPVAPDQQQDR